MTLLTMESALQCRPPNRPPTAFECRRYRRSFSISWHKLRHRVAQRRAQSRPFPPLPHLNTYIYACCPFRQEVKCGEKNVSFRFGQGVVIFASSPRASKQTCVAINQTQHNGECVVATGFLLVRGPVPGHVCHVV